MLPIIAALPPFHYTDNRQLKLNIFATNWGFGGSLNEFCAQAKADGYDGIEVWVPSDPKKQELLLELTQAYDLRLGLLVGSSGDTIRAHTSSFQLALHQATQMQPSFINCHSGKDYFGISDGQHFIELTKQLSEVSGVAIYHETHRGRILYAAHITDQYINHHEDLRLTLDISHWCNVHESLLADQSEVIARALRRTDHIHARVGFAEGPQIPNHNDPQYQAAVEAHFAWWDEVVAHKISTGQVLTMTTEFGPPPYMWTHPFTAQPLADVWEVNRAMMHLWRRRYQQ